MPLPHRYRSLQRPALCYRHRLSLPDHLQTIGRPYIHTGDGIGQRGPYWAQFGTPGRHHIDLHHAKTLVYALPNQKQIKLNKSGLRLRNKSIKSNQTLQNSNQIKSRTSNRFDLIVASSSLYEVYLRVASQSTRFQY